jgi:predicted nucleic acid-binding protein
MAEKVGPRRSPRPEKTSAGSERPPAARGSAPISIEDAGITRARTFFDSNILLYADDARFAAKQKRALDLILHHRQQNTAVLSLQVLQEYFANATRKLGIDPVDARHKVELFSRFLLVEPNLSDVYAATDIYRLHRINYWDAMVVHCARKSGCRIVLTEDLQHNQLIDGVRIVNPFL